jgi:hypothetical protein
VALAALASRDKRPTEAAAAIKIADRLAVLPHGWRAAPETPRRVKIDPLCIVPPPERKLRLPEHAQHHWCERPNYHSLNSID